MQEVVEYVGAVNYHHMLLFLKAEEAAATSEIPEYVRKAYDEAIRSAKRSGFLQHGALMNERCGLYFIEQKEEDGYWSTVYISQARQLYTE